MVKRGKSNLTKTEREIKKVSDKIVNIISRPLENIRTSFSPTKPFSSNQKKLTTGQKTADWLTEWAGSWTFILSFLIILLLWIIINSTWIIFGRSWDPYPFILLNLFLSMLAALQAPIILMSQNRSTERDRQRVKYDYLVNRKAEREIQELRKQLNRIEKKL